MFFDLGVRLRGEVKFSMLSERLHDSFSQVTIWKSISPRKIEAASGEEKMITSDKSSGVVTMEFKLPGF